ncbi:TIGR02217 family protein [Zhengella sp. ZM62]|uniref:phage distal tail protein, Rcc01695 family n=1 Tax=Zhengella sedimenti TaxID=3390035 RepID=UPI0039758662
MNAFHDVRFPVAIGFGATGGPERMNEIVRLTSGQERRNQRRAHARRRYDAGTGLRGLADLEALADFFEARRGSLHAFRFRDPFDWKSCPLAREPRADDQWIATGDGTATVFQLVKTYGEGADAYRRPITKPDAASVRIALDGVPLAGGTAFAVDGLTGQVKLNEAPGEGVRITAGFVFDVPVRFDTDHLVLSLSAFEAGQLPSVPLVEVLP